ncbi:ABC transporter ATP-binding protein [Siphonobacter aquaeclarae]|jgi:ATP-binding cassette subfamily B protein|uniref:ABC transporter, permease/ATP-binding protein n=1 Tax=Siphonobacter aquaeclarae TaxID=563176 RepID=A0A1G9VI70_9BACT|nr:ABC transporter transmembrane domain-containing protein [Siphonobacter aquaeclarae]MBO9636731.1 ATP-binding cassette domain-containing protein [Siphonobacter aquaeclarae]SDM71859.1 ABC transporter, permease/ATP-binding protein [Siphonobacter aquaeclarae]
MAKRSFGEEPSPEDKKKVNREGLNKALRIFRFVKPYRGLFLIGLVFLALSQVTMMSFPLLIREIVAVLEKKSQFTLNHVLMALFAVLIGQALFSFGRIYYFTRVSERTMADVRRSLYSKIVTLPIRFFEQRRVGELMSRMTSDVTQLQDVLTITLAELLRGVATLVIGTVVIVTISWKLTLFMLATFPVLVVAAMIFGRYIRKMSKAAQDELAGANIVVEETLQSIQIVKAFTNENLEINRYTSALDRVVKTALKASMFRGTFVSFIIFALFGGIIGVVWYGASLVQSGEMIMADLFGFVLYTAFIGGSVGGLGDMYAQVQKTVGASERILEILDETSEVQPGVGEAIATPVEGEISFRNIRFSYPSRPDVQVLKDISLQVRKGEKIALVGYSGAGKSTIVQLLMRYHTPQGGHIFVDGKDIAGFNITDYRKHIAVVPQEVMLFGGTIRENIAYGRPGATTAEIEEAARKANAYQFILSFPEGFETVVGERGVKLSGGQRQRIAIARAILKDPAILILDEATSSLDAESEKLVQEALDGLMENRTTIIIAHRLATIRNVDQIYVLQQGEIVEQGTHEELSLLEAGLYSGLVKLQFENALNLE